jgi:FtsH-binding integral membrane protein
MARAPKKLQTESKYEKYDLDGDGIITDEEIAMDERMTRLENEDKKEDAQRMMAWFSLLGMLLYPALVVFSVLCNLESAAQILGNMAPTYFVSVAAIVAAFFAKEAYNKNKDTSSK